MAFAILVVLWSSIFNGIFFSALQATKLVLLLSIAYLFYKKNLNKLILLADAFLIALIYALFFDGFLLANHMPANAIVDGLWQAHNENIPWIFLSTSMLVYWFFSSHSRLVFVLLLYLCLFFLNQAEVSRASMVLVLCVCSSILFPRITVQNEIFSKILIKAVVILSWLTICLVIVGVMFANLDSTFFPAPLSVLDTYSSKRVYYILDATTIETVGGLGFVRVKPFDSIVWEVIFVAGPSLWIIFYRAVKNIFSKIRENKRQCLLIGFVGLFGLVEGVVLKITPATILVISLLLASEAEKKNA
ncbi:MAG: hypothetical protein VW124_14335 [Paracoccaceae bacterium]